MKQKPYTRLPFALIDAKPHPDASRLTGVRPGGEPDGRHTGGAWLYGGMVYKPTDATGDTCRYYTKEAEILKAVAGMPLFPRNWTLQTIRDEALDMDRTYIVRAQSLIVGQDIPYNKLSRAQVLEVEAGVRGLNAAGYEVNDPLGIAIDPYDETLYIYDMSIAQPMRGAPPYHADDQFHIMEFLKLADPGIYDLRRLSRNALHVATYDDPNIISGNQLHEAQAYRHVYASWTRPFGFDLKQPYKVANQLSDDNTPLSWVFTKEVIPMDMIERYELEWGYSRS